MRKAITTTIMVLALSAGFSTSGLADVDVHIGIGVPPPVVFAAPPEVIVIPGTYVYVVPGMADDIFFFDGYWWRPWKGRWYRSLSYSGGWVYYKNPPTAVVKIPSSWRVDYRNRRWGGYEWDYRPIPYHEFEKNWKSWEKSKHWDKPEYRQVITEPRSGEGKQHFYRKQETFEGKKPEAIEKKQTIEKRRQETFEKQQMKPSEKSELKGRQSEGRQKEGLKEKETEGRQKEGLKEKENKGRM